MQKKETKNKNIQVVKPLFIRCTKDKRIKISPMYVRHNTKNDDLYYKIELQKSELGNGEWTVVHGNEKWNIQQQGIEDLFDFITATTALKTKEIVSVLNTTEEQIAVIENLLKDGKLSNLIKNGVLKDENLSELKSIIRISEMEKAITDLEYLLVTSDTEKDFENWCCDNVWAFGNYYVAKESIHQISNAEKVDLLLKNALNCYRDIIEFKKPSFAILEFDSSHNNYYFSKEVSKAISQVINYSDIFESVAEQGLHRHEEIKAYYPKSIIVVGRSNHFNQEQIRALHALNGRLTGIEIKSYDDLLLQAKNLLAVLKGNAESNSKQETFDDDDIPF